MNEHKPVSIGLLDSSTASLYVPFLIASTVFLVEPVSLAICELLNSVGYLFISHRIAKGFSCLKDKGVYLVSFFLGGKESTILDFINSNLAEESFSHLIISSLVNCLLSIGSYPRIPIATSPSAIP